MRAIRSKSSGGKTFFISLILAIASSGIAETPVDGGRIAHSGLKLPLNIQICQRYTCNITKNFGISKILQTCKLTTWDECTLAHK